MNSDLDKLKNLLCHGEFSSLIISWNDGNGPNYQSVKDHIEGLDYYDERDFVSPGEKQKCMETNSIWTAHWYPNTPVGFNSCHASTFEALYNHLLKVVHEQ